MNAAEYFPSDPDDLWASVGVMVVLGVGLALSFVSSEPPAIFSFLSIYQLRVFAVVSMVVLVAMCVTLAVGRRQGRPRLEYNSGNLYSVTLFGRRRQFVTDRLRLDDLKKSLLQRCRISDGRHSIVLARTAGETSEWLASVGVPIKRSA